MYTSINMNIISIQKYKNWPNILTWIYYFDIETITN